MSALIALLAVTLDVGWRLMAVILILGLLWGIVTAGTRQ